MQYRTAATAAAATTTTTTHYFYHHHYFHFSLNWSLSCREASAFSLCQFCWCYSGLGPVSISDQLGIVAAVTRFQSPKATYIRLLHGKMGFFGGFSALAP